MKIRYLFAAILMTFALAFAASANGMSVARGPTITAVISIDLALTPSDIDSLLIAELGVQYGFAEKDTDNIISKHNTEGNYTLNSLFLLLIDRSASRP